MTPRFPRLRIVIGLMLTLTIATVAWTQVVFAQDSTPSTSDDATTTLTADPEPLTTVEVVQEVQSAVVTVVTTMTAGFGGPSAQASGTGTGFVVDEDGHIVTNWHVVEGGTGYTVLLADGTEVEATMIGEDPRNDLAVLQISADAVTDTVTLASSADIQVGETVLAMGSPLGTFDNSVTQGIVSALDRDQFGTGGLCLAYSGLIQHDAAINPGNSGGPLFDLNGEVVGVNTLGVTATGTGSAAQGLGFAVPSDTVATSVEQIIAQGYVSAPYLGISVASAIQTGGMGVTDGAMEVRAVETGGPAANAGIVAGDRIVAIDGTTLDVDTTLSATLADHAPGDEVALTVERNGTNIELTTTLGEAPREALDGCTLQGVS